MSEAVTFEICQVKTMPLMKMKRYTLHFLHTIKTVKNFSETVRKIRKTILADNQASIQEFKGGT